MQRLNSTGMTVSRYLESHPRIRRVYYPGLASHPHHEVAKRQMKGFGAVVTFEMEDDIGKVHRFL
jgi:cystathionine beta-lyase/cystathionine gamma-synthase